MFNLDYFFSCQKGDFVDLECNFKYACKFLEFFLLVIVNKKKQRKRIGSVIDSRDLKIIILPFFTNKMVFMTTYFIIPLPNMLFVNVFFEQHLQTVLGSPTGFIGVPVFVH